MTEQSIPEEVINLKLRVLELAEKTVHQPYVSNVGSASPGSDYYRDKDLHEIFSRADKIMRYILDPAQTDTQSSLIEKLRSILCQDSTRTK